MRRRTASSQLHRLAAFHSLPEALRDNEFITKYYSTRQRDGSLLNILVSVLQVSLINPRVCRSQLQRQADHQIAVWPAQ